MPTKITEVPILPSSSIVGTENLVAADVDGELILINVKQFESANDQHTVKYESADFTAFNGHTYLIDATLGPITVTLDEGAEHFHIEDYDKTWTDTNKIIVVLGTDSFEFKLVHQSRKYEFSKVGALWRVYLNGVFQAQGAV